MPEYEDTASVAAAPDAVFGYVSDVAHLPDYIPNMILAQPEADRLLVAAEVQGRREEGTAWLLADRNRRRLEWSGEGTSRYRGWLQVSSADEGSSVTIHLSSDREEDAEEISQSLSDALLNIKRQVEDP